MAGKATGKGKERTGEGNGRRYDRRKGRKGWGICAIPFSPSFCHK